MKIDEGMVVTVGELGMRFVVTSLIGDYEYGYDGQRVYTRIDLMTLVPLRALAENMRI